MFKAQEGRSHWINKSKQGLLAPQDPQSLAVSLLFAAQRPSLGKLQGFWLGKQYVLGSRKSGELAFGKVSGLRVD